MERYVRSNLILVRERSSFNNFHDTMSAFMIAFLFYSLMYFLFAQHELFIQYYLENDNWGDVYSDNSLDAPYEYINSSVDYELFEENIYENMSFNTDSDYEHNIDEIDVIYNNRHSTPIELTESDNDGEEMNQERDAEIIEHDERDALAVWFSNLLPHERFTLRCAILNAVIREQGFGLNIINRQTVTTPYGAVDVTQELYHYLLYEGNDFNGNPRFDPFSDFF